MTGNGLSLTLLPLHRAQKQPQALLWLPLLLEKRLKRSKMSRLLQLWSDANLNVLSQ